MRLDHYIPSPDRTRRPFRNLTRGRILAKYPNARSFPCPDNLHAPTARMGDLLWIAAARVEWEGQFSLAECPRLLYPDLTISAIGRAYALLPGVAFLAVPPLFEGGEYAVAPIRRAQAIVAVTDPVGKPLRSNACERRCTIAGAFAVLRHVENEPLWDRSPARIEAARRLLARVQSVTLIERTAA